MKAHRTRSLYTILALSLLLKLAALAFATPSSFFDSDSLGYEQPARALLRHGTLAISPDRPQVPETLRTPGYPLLIAALYGLSGERPAAVILFQILLSTASLGLVYALASRLWGDSRAALAASLLLATDALSAIYALRILTETLQSFLLLVLVAAGLRYLDSEGRPRWAAAAGCTLAFATLVRPIGAYLVFLLVPALLIWAAVRRLPASRRLAAAAALLLPPLLLVGGWQLRNWRLTGSGELSQIAGVNMLFYRGAAIVAARDGVSLHTARQRLAEGRYPEILARAREHPELRLGASWKRRGLKLILAHPLLFARAQGAGLAKLTLTAGESSILRTFGVTMEEGGPLGDLRRLAPSAYLRRWPLGNPLPFAVFAGVLIHLGVVYLGLGARLAAWLRRPRLDPGHLFILILLLYFAGISLGPESHFRFRVPLMPILCLHAGRGLVDLLSFARLRSPGE